MLEVRNLSKNFTLGHNLLARLGHSDQIIQAVRNVSFGVKRGEIFGIAGKSGSGKTTLGKTILRLLEPDGGSVLYKGSEIFKFSPGDLKQYRRQVQVVFQDADSTLNPRQSLYSALEEPLLIHCVGAKKQRQKAISKALEQVNLPYSLTGRYPSELSGGQRRRAALARALVLEPELIIADEPNTGLDPVVSAQVLALLLELNRQHNLSLILISHDLAAINYLSNRVAVMYGGKIVEMIDGSMFEFFSRHPYTRFLQGFNGDVILQNGVCDVHAKSRVSDEGCVYVACCPEARDECFKASPELTRVAFGHLVACHRVHGPGR